MQLKNIKDKIKKNKNYCKKKKQKEQTSIFAKKYVENEKNEEQEEEINTSTAINPANKC